MHTFAIPDGKKPKVVRGGLEREIADHFSFDQFPNKMIHGIRADDEKIVFRVSFIHDLKTLSSNLFPVLLKLFRRNSISGILMLRRREDLQLAAFRIQNTDGEGNGKKEERGKKRSGTVDQIEFAFFHVCLLRKQVGNAQACTDFRPLRLAAFKNFSMFLYGIFDTLSD